MNNTKRMMSRVKSIKIEIITDDGVTITKFIDNKKIMSITGLDAGIHNMSSVLGFIEGGDTEKHLAENPLLTPLIEDVRSGKIKRIYRDSYNNVITGLLDTPGYKTKEYTYSSFSECLDDYNYCKKLLD